MEFPLIGVIGANSSEAAAGEEMSLYSQMPVVAALYVGVLGVAAVVGTFGNLVVFVAVTAKHLHISRHRADTARKDLGQAFIANLALSDMVVTAVINPLAVLGLYYTRLIISLTDIILGVIGIS